MADDESEIQVATMDLNLYLGLPRSPRPRILDLGSDLSLTSLPLPASSDSSESRAPEATSESMVASTSHAPYSPSHDFIAEADVPSAGTWRSTVENPIPSYFLAYESYGPVCARESEGPSILYSPSNAQVLQEEQVAVEPTEIEVEYHASFDDTLGIHLVDHNSVQGDGSQTIYSPPFHPPIFQDEENFGTFPSLPPSQNGSELYSRADGSSPQQDLLLSPRIRRLIESHGWRQRSLRQSLIYDADRTSFDPHSSPSPEQLMLDIMSSQRSLDANGKAEVVDTESSEKEAVEKDRNVTDFDCNICFDIAKEPVVTPCGHLFCWPCLYQWLLVHSDHKECPICKGEVVEANITPIYGRGDSQSDFENNDDKNCAASLTIPPRPRGNRLESWRQHFYPISRRIGEGIANTWRHFLNYQMHNGSRFSGHEEALMQEILSGGPPAILVRSMARRLQREQGITESGPSTLERRFLRDGVQGIDCFLDSDRLTAMNSEIGRDFRRFTGNSDQYGASSSSNTPISSQFISMPVVGARLVADQASASSTVAVISGESSARTTSAEPNSAGSLRPYRIIGGGNASGGSFDDGGNLRARKRRRLH